MPKTLHLDPTSVALLESTLLLDTDSRTLPDLPNKKNKTNWVEKAGGLPSYIKRIAKHLHSEKGMDVGHAIATAVNTVKKWAVGGGGVSDKTKALAAKAVAQWEAKKGKALATSQGDPLVTVYGVQVALSDRDLILSLAQEFGAEPHDGLDLAAYEAALEAEREKLNLAIEFKEQLHPRDWRGKFRKTMAAVKSDVESYLSNQEAPHLRSQDDQDEWTAGVVQDALKEALLKHDPDQILEESVGTTHDSVEFPDGSEVRITSKGAKVSPSHPEQLDRHLDEIAPHMDELHDEKFAPGDVVELTEFGEPHPRGVVDRITDSGALEVTHDQDGGGFDFWPAESVRRVKDTLAEADPWPDDPDLFTPDHIVPDESADDDFARTEQLQSVLPANWASSIVGGSGRVATPEGFVYTFAHGEHGWNVNELLPGEDQLPASEIPIDRQHFVGDTFGDVVDYFTRQTGSH